MDGFCNFTGSAALYDFLCQIILQVYVSVGEFAKAREVYEAIAKINNKPMFSNKLKG